MKKLIGPIVIGALMFAAAFGGAFFYYRYAKEKAATAARDLTGETLSDLQHDGRSPALTARLLAVVPVTSAPAGGETDGTATGGVSVLLAVPAFVRYDLDMRDAQAKDIAWDAETKALRIKVPALTLSEPQIDVGGIRILAGAAWAPFHAALDGETRKVALGQLLSQAREDAVLGAARDTARASLQRAFAAKLREAGEKASVEIRFADEKSDDHGGDQQAAAPEE